MAFGDAIVLLGREDASDGRAHTEGLEIVAGYQFRVDASTPQGRKSLQEVVEIYRRDRSRTAISLNRIFPSPPECSCRAIPPSKDLGLGSVKSITVIPLRMQIM